MKILAFILLALASCEKKEVAPVGAPEPESKMTFKISCWNRDSRGEPFVNTHLEDFFMIEGYGSLCQRRTIELVRVYKHIVHVNSQDNVEWEDSSHVR